MERLKQAAAWVIRGLLIIIILLFAMKNAEPMTLKFYFGQSWQAPVALVLFITLALGAALGLLAALERIFAQRREIQDLQRELRARENAEAASAAAPAPVPDIEPRQAD
jgi:putative membrane protein